MLRPRRAFTLAEVLVSVAIVAILAAVLVPTMRGKMQDSYENAIISEFNNIESAVAAYRQDVGKYPADIDYLFPDADFAKDRGLSDHMIKAWTDFARTGDPGWPRFDEGQYVQSLAPGAIGRVDCAAEHKLPFWR